MICVYFIIFEYKKMMMMNIYMQSNKKSVCTIDEKHTEMLDLFYKNDTVMIPQLKKEMLDLKIKQSKSLKKIEEYLDIVDQLKEKKQQIVMMKLKKKTYFLENSRYIFDYFEGKKNISEGGGKTNVNVLNNFFKIKSNDNEFADITNKKYLESNLIYQRYWKNVTNEISNIQDYVVSCDICQNCHKGEMIPHDEEGILICNNKDCSIFVSYIVDNAKPSNKEPPNEVSYTAYIRLNHFKEILSQFQAKETTQIPPHVIEAIKGRIIKERITDTTKLNYDKMREILRKLGLNKYFEHIQYINSLFGIKPPHMNEELHETLCVLFIEIQRPWALHCPLNRTNFFNYTYTLYQLCVLLDQTQYLPFILLMKDLDKQREQDQIWKKVCGSLDWCFIPSL